MENQTTPVELLSLFESGVLAVTVNGRPLLKVDAESRSVESEVSGMRETGIKLSNLSDSGPGVLGLLKTSRSTAKDLYEKGWKFSLYDKGSRILSMGRGVSRLTGHIQVSPTKIRSILEAV